jgi:hypothetical protein
MSELDLSFVTTKGAIDKPVESGALDLSFVDSPKLSSVQTAEKIVQQQDSGGFPQGARNERGVFDKIGDVITGSDRETNATRKLPELGTDIGLGEFLGADISHTAKSYKETVQEGVPLAAAALTTTDPIEMVKILSEQAGDRLSVRPDEAGNIILSLDGREAMLNKPGFSMFDAMQLGGFMAAFSPAAKTGAGASTILRGAAKVGATSTATQAGIEGVQESQGGDFNKADIAITGATAGVLQGLFQKVAQHIPALRQKIKETGITDEIRDIYQKTAVRLGMSADDITDDVIRESTRNATGAVTPETGLALRGEKEFAVPLTQGQRSLDDAALSFEDRARVGLSGESAQRVMRGFEDEIQKPAVIAAKEGIESTIGGASTGSPGGVIREGVKTAERTADDAVGAAYDAVGSAELSVGGVKELFRHVKNSVRGVEFDKTLPQTAGLLSEVSKGQKLIKAFEGRGLKGTNLSQIENMRKRINTALSAADNPADKRQVTLIKRSFDDYLDSAVQKALFSGDENALSTLKEARGLFSEYAKKFRAQPVRGKSGRIVDRDESGQFIEKLIDADPTDEQVVNAVFGASGMNKLSGAAMAARFRDILGPESDGWSAVRRSAVKRLIQTTRDGKGVETVSGAKTLTALDKAMENNASLMKEVFSNDEIGMLRRFAAHVKRTQAAPAKSRENPSGTAQVAGKALGEIVNRVGQLFALSGQPIVLATTTGAQMARGATQGGKAAAAIRPFSQTASVKPVLVSAAIGATQ